MMASFSWTHVASAHTKQSFRCEYSSSSNSKKCIRLNESRSKNKNIRIYYDLVSVRDPTTPTTILHAPWIYQIEICLFVFFWVFIPLFLSSFRCERVKSELCWTRKSSWWMNEMDEWSETSDGHWGWCRRRRQRRQCWNIFSQFTHTHESFACFAMRNA